MAATIILSLGREATMTEHEAIELLEHLRSEYAEAITTDSSTRPEVMFGWQVRDVLKALHNPDVPYRQHA